MAARGDSTREQIVVAATRLFYGEGIRAVSMDAVAEKAGVTKKTLYYHFTSKDELVAETIAARDQPTLELYMRWFAETDGTVADKVRGLFTRLGKSVDTPKWRGCGFLRTIAELANTPAHPAVKAGAAHKKRFEAWLETELRDHGIHGAAGLARQIVILLDGATTVMLIHRDLDYVDAAGRLALDLVEQAPRAS
ncbi:TetR/AcrR family transcriptional regulator [Bradyrhizobium sp. CIAT3101]|uniref:TetR/AcrR family transcriptional regulator n=1 Tax=Bradyrhizobium sp. CIAT3101 TaxID=439387 RepID=UPI0024B11010|nr:TetR/AcrR family transcriptional regulator [Bradyrhizobium sp. CIAT3101]WFU84256.1 TetR/AcrR family transcriptional regulator [Bradyrhizobium sp. CIAT3101]